ncbi:hypothetical protein Psi01_43060 [Planobispora siamensis]|uniref:Uncharacterized protein n=1 Tax=Planobispora siamensis TaxID=936338 RepID=A0A8J3WNA8_9ACTN|nr:hypothetical protein Psi01_43060 [Planobispora siamensis]
MGEAVGEAGENAAGDAGPLAEAGEAAASGAVSEAASTAAVTAAAAAGRLPLRPVSRAAGCGETVWCMGSSVRVGTG